MNANNPNAEIFTPSASELDFAREDLTEALLAGKSFHGVDLEVLLDTHFDYNRAMAIRTLYEEFSGIGTSGTFASERCEHIGKWMEQLVKEHLDANPNLIIERAETIEAEARADMEEA